MKCLRGSRISFFFLAVSITLNGCTPEKARSLRVTAVQFKAESIAAIKAIEETHQRELTTLSLAQIELRNNVINTIRTSKNTIVLPPCEVSYKPYLPTIIVHKLKPNNILARCWGKRLRNG